MLVQDGSRTLRLMFPLLKCTSTMDVTTAIDVEDLAPPPSALPSRRFHFLSSFTLCADSLSVCSLTIDISQSLPVILSYSEHVYWVSVLFKCFCKFCVISILRFFLSKHLQIGKYFRC